MSTPATTASDFGPSTVAVRIENRVFPKQAPAASAAPLRADGTGGTIADIRRELTDKLIGRLPLNLLATSTSEGKEPLIAGYIECLSQVEQFRADFEQLVRAICVASIESRWSRDSFELNRWLVEEVKDATQRVESAKLDELAERAGLRLMPSRNMVTAAAITRPLEVIRSDFDRALRQAVNEFVGQVFETLEHMVDEQMVGLIEWFGGNVCRYHFFKAVVEHTAEELSGEFDDDDDIAFDMDDDDDSFMDATAQSMPIRHIHRLARHEHHAINAFCTSIDNSRVVIPDNVQQMIATIPDWLRPSVRVVDGTLVRELIVERHERTEVTDLPVYGWEPAVIIGHFVLTGWGPREIEQQRKQIAVAAAQVRPEESNKWVGLFWLTVAAVVATGLLARSVHPTFAIVSTVLVVFAVWCLMRGLDQQPQPPAVNR